VKTYSSTLHLTPDEVGSILREHFGLANSLGVKSEINFMLEEGVGRFVGVDIKLPVTIVRGQVKSDATLDK